MLRPKKLSSNVACRDIHIVQNLIVIFNKLPTLQIHTVEVQCKCNETTVLLKKYSGLPQTMLHCIFYQ